MNPPDIPSAARLAAADETLRHSHYELDTLRKQLAQAAFLLKALPAMPVVPSLVFSRPGSSEVECVPIGAGVAVGRGEDCEIRFEVRKELSRRHFGVSPVEHGFIVEDLGSSNGTTVAGVAGKIQSRELRDGDLVQAGGVDFLFVRPE
jgi:hypothetical protein